MKPSLMTIALACTAAAGAGAQQNPKPVDAPSSVDAGAPRTPPPKPGMICKDGVCVEQAPAKEEKGEKASAGYTPGTGLQYKSATDDVTLYGLLDITLSSNDHQDATGARRNGYQTSWFSGDRWGIAGKHLFDAGPEKFGIAFKLESEYVLNTGEMDTPGVLFNRDAWIGFESETLGQIHFGRQNTVSRDFSSNYGDPYGAAEVRLDEGGWTNTNNFKQLIFYAGSVTGTRYDNGIVWKKKLGPLVAGLGYQFGEVVGDFMKNSTQSAGLGFNGGLFNVSGFVTHANVNGLDHQTVSFGGNVAPARLLRLNAGYFHYWADQGATGQRTDDAFTVSAKVSPEGPFDFEVGFQVMKASNFGYLGGNTPNAFKDMSSAKTTGDGNKKTFYGSIFYHLDKRAEVYLAGDYMKLFGGYKLGVTNGFGDQTELALGLRFRF